MSDKEFVSSPIKDIRIKDFQGVKDITLTLPEKGVIWIEGESEIGKSAMLKALSALANNVPNIHYKEDIRQGASSFFVSATFYDGNKITLSRGEIDYYEWEIDGNIGRFDNTKGQVPIEVENYFNLYIEKERTKRNLNFNLAEDNLPFVNTTDGDDYWLFQRGLGTSSFLLAQREVKTIARKLKSMKEVKSELLEEETEKKEYWTSVKSTLDTKVEDLKHINNNIKSYFNKIDSINNTLGKEKLLADILDRKNKLYVGIGDDEIKDISNILDHIEKLSLSIGHIKETADLREKIDVLKQSSDFLGENSENIENLISEINLLGNMIDSMVGLDVDRANISLKENQIASLSEIDSVNIHEISKINNQINAIKNIEELSKNKDKYALALKVLDDKLEEVKEELGYCPLCHQSLIEHKEH